MVLPVGGAMYHTIFLSLLILVQSANACTTFGLEKDKKLTFGKSYDWDEGQGAILINKAGVKKTALRLKFSDKPASWQSQFGSITFNQQGREFPLGGMNEKGLVVEIMLGPVQDIPETDNRESINELQWIQYVLDNYDSIDKLLHGDDKTKPISQIRLSRAVANVHYLVCDAQAECASVEFLDQKVTIHSSIEAPFLAAKAFTNSSYKASAAALPEFLGFGGMKAIPADEGSISRFVRTAFQLKNFDPTTDVEAYAKKILHSVDRSAGLWQIVYSAGEKIAIRIKSVGQEKVVKISDFDYSCKSSVKLLDLEASSWGEVGPTDFDEYSLENNAKILEKSKKVPQALKAVLAAYPESTKCMVR